jgi:hypothetical protein
MRSNQARSTGGGAAGLVLALALAAGACAAGDTPAGGGAGTISGEVRYDGAEVGTLRVSAFTRFPPIGAPTAEVAIDAPRFPQPYQLSGLPPGRYFVLAIVDVDPGDGDRYRPRVDPGGAFGRSLSPAAITVELSAPRDGVDVVLDPPHQGSPWDR